MASFSTAYGLCSLIEQKGFLHVSQDEPDCAVVTLGKNIVIRYRLTDQKQLNSWSTIQKLTSKVVFNEATSEYIGIFNGVNIRKWTKVDSSLERVSKIKLKEIAHEVFCDDELIVLFQSGACCKLSYVENKNHETLKGFLSDDSKILASKIIQLEDVKYLLLTATNGKKHTMCYSVRLHPSTLQPLADSVKKIALKRPGLRLLGSCFLSRDSGEMLVTLWSDGFIYALPIPLISEPGMGRFMGTVRSVSTSTEVAMLALSSHHIALYGGDPAEEGALLAIYNLDFGMAQASTSFKLLQNPAMVWAVHGRLLLAMGQRLVCVPYALQTGSVRALVGTRPLGRDAASTDVLPVVPTVGWEDGAQVETSESAPKNMKVLMDTLAEQGCSEAGICESMISELLEKQSVEDLCWCLDHFIDIPERLSVQLVNFALTAPDSVFAGGVRKSPRKTSKKEPQDVPVNGESKEAKDLGCPLHPAERASFASRVLQVPINKSSLMSALRTTVQFPDCLLLLNYLNHLLTTENMEARTNILDWTEGIIDAFYQQFLLSRDSFVLETVVELKDTVNEEITALNELQTLLPLLLRLRNGKGLPKQPVQAKSYSIQRFQLYK